MNIINSLCTKSDCYKANKKIIVKGLMIHSVGCPQPKASTFINNWNRPDVNVCVQAIVEPKGNIYQLLPWNHKGWHGGGESNNTHIGVEMTEPSTINYTNGSKWVEIGDGSNTKAHVLSTYKYAVELFAFLCKEYSLDPLADGVIISHSEGHKRKIASNHGDVEHLWKIFGLSMAQFRKDIKNKMDTLEDISLTDINVEKQVSYRVRTAWEDEKSQKGAYKIFDNAKKCADSNPGYHVFDEKGVIVYPKSVNRKTILYGKLRSDMNIRAEANAETSMIVEYCKGTIIEIVEVCSNGWYQIRCNESESNYAYVSNVSDNYVSVGSSVYTVEKGDSLWNISQSLLGNGNRYKEIKTLNGLSNDRICVGDLLLIP